VIKSNSLGNRLQVIKQQTMNHLDAEQGEDDISLLAIKCQQELES